MTSFALHQPYYDIKQLRPCSTLFYTQTHTHSHTPTHTHMRTQSIVVTDVRAFQHGFYQFPVVSTMFWTRIENHNNKSQAKERTHKNNGVWQWKCGKTPRTGHKLCPIVMKYCDGRCVCVYFCVWVMYTLAECRTPRSTHQTYIYGWAKRHTKVVINAACNKWQFTHNISTERYDLHWMGLRIWYLCSSPPFPFPMTEWVGWVDASLHWTGSEGREASRISWIQLKCADIRGQYGQ